MSIEGLEDPTDYEIMDKPDFFDRRFFNADKYKAEGQEFLDKIDMGTEQSLERCFY